LVDTQNHHKNNNTLSNLPYITISGHVLFPQTNTVAIVLFSFFVKNRLKYSPQHNDGKNKPRTGVPLTRKRSYYSTYNAI